MLPYGMNCWGVGGGGIRQEKERVVLSANGSKAEAIWSPKEAANKRKKKRVFAKKLEWKN